jgi:hypothetical protein
LTRLSCRRHISRISASKAGKLPWSQSGNIMKSTKERRPSGAPPKIHPFISTAANFHFSAAVFFALKAGFHYLVYLPKTQDPAINKPITNLYIYLV